MAAKNLEEFLKTMGQEVANNGALGEAMEVVMEDMSEERQVMMEERQVMIEERQAITEELKGMKEQLRVLQEDNKSSSGIIKKQGEKIQVLEAELAKSAGVRAEELFHILPASNASLARGVAENAERCKNIMELMEQLKRKKRQREEEDEDDTDQGVSMTMESSSNNPPPAATAPAERKFFKHFRPGTTTQSNNKNKSPKHKK